MIKQAMASRSKGSPPQRPQAELPARADRSDENALEYPGKSDLPPSPRTKSSPSGATPPASGEKSPTTGADDAEPAALSTETGLKLEALAWASAPESRFAVISSQIVREGDSVGGAKVERIEKEQVVLRREGKLWQLRHRPQR
ncbi:MAG: general secretion pathway protein GspB [Pseudomonadota bacterium]